MPGLGRVQKQDLRDLNFLAAPILPTPVRRYRYWNDTGWWGDQGVTPKCVAFSFAHLIEDGPITHRGTAPILDPNDLYARCKRVDGIPNEEGTYIRTAAQLLVDLGYIDQYRWCLNLDEIITAVLEKCPVEMGTVWRSGMFNPDADTFRIALKGPVVGGHAYLLNGYNKNNGYFRLKNSWGRGWGQGGHAWIHHDYVAELLEDQGEACVITELR